jgi:PAS domain S-box-containing protein
VFHIPKVTFLSSETKTYRLFAEQLRDCLGSLVEIEGYSLESGPPDRIEATIAVAATPCALRQFASRITPETHAIVAKRGITTAKMEEILLIPRGSQVLVVSRNLDSAQATGQMLRDLGMDHIEYLPWSPGLPTPEVSIAITPGAPHLVPPHIARVIDIGLLPMDLTTLIDIAVACGLPWEVVTNIALQHTRATVQLSQRLSAALTEVHESNARLEVLIGSLEDGVIYVDREGVSKVSNRTAQELLGVGPDTLRGKALGAVIGRKTIQETLSGGVSNHTIEEVGPRKVSMTTIPVSKQGEVSGAICVLRDISAVSRLEQEIVRSLSSGHIARFKVNDIIGKSPATKRSVERIRRIAQTDLTVLISGESGVGKEVSAQAIHNLSSRRHGPFVAVNFAALPESLAESELFGYEEGAFTGARRGGHRGYFEKAHKGTVFLDEIGDASPAVQAALLRVLQEKTVTRVGGSKVIPLDFRVIAATNRSLKRMVAEGRFRRDLYYRLNVLNLTIPPLRERKEDIPGLLDYFLRRWGKRLRIEPEAMRALIDYDWPGNVREVENVAANLALAASGGVITLDDLPEAFGADRVDPLHEHTSIAMGGVPAFLPPQLPYAGRQDELTGDIKELQRHGDLRLFKEILEYLDRLAGETGIGYAKLSRSLPNPIKPHVARRYLRRLVEVGACASGTTREGTRITLKGRALLGLFRINYALLNHRD